jgi:hypothetical protein
MQPEDSLSCLQKPTTGPYPEPGESSPCRHTPFLYDSFSYFIHVDFSQMASSVQVLQLKFCMLATSTMCYYPSFSLIGSP